MTIDYVSEENRLDAILEAGDWLIDQAVERAIRRNQIDFPKPKAILPKLDAKSELMRQLVDAAPFSGKVLWMSDQQMREMQGTPFADARLAAMAMNQQAQSMYNAGIGSLFGGQIAQGSLGPLGSLFR